MQKRRKYRATDVKDVALESLLAGAPQGAAVAGLDISKFEAFAVMRSRDGSFERPWKAKAPSQIDELVKVLRHVGQERPLMVAMESTGTYGDALRARLTAAGLNVQRVGGKAAHDYAEVFDGVPSQHDGKDAAVIAELAAFGKSSLAAREETKKAKRELEVLAQNCDVLKRQAQMIGAATACVLWAVVGDPRDYPCGAAYRKAMGLNLKERSSGKHKGQLKITKRGPSLARRWLFFAAMRTVQNPPARGWYEGKKARDKDRGKGALTAVMRKQALALWAVGARGEHFEEWRLFPGRSTARRAAQSRRCVL